MMITCDDVRDLAAGFVLGALAPDQAEAVREHLATCVEPHPELAELGGVVPYLATSVDPVEPPAVLRRRIIAAAAAERAGSAATVLTPAAAPVAPSAIPFSGAAKRVAHAARPRPWGTWVLRVAAALAILALGAWNLQLQARLSGVEDDLASAQAYQQGVATVLEVATQPGAANAFLVAAEPGTSASGLVAVGPDGTVVMAIQDLAPTTGRQVYEAWVIVGDAAPIPLGGFTVGDGGKGLFRGSTALAGPGAVLALTLEPGPGAAAPTLPVLAVGSLTSGS
jgi:hypothetical protein